ncbi:DUF4145 domain-containing protein [bacterium]|nr:DUF4145 domain-containing protein [bacterium]
MSETENTFTENKSKGTFLNVQCTNCKVPTRHQVAASLDRSGSEFDRHEGWSVDWTDDYQILQCQGCESVSFRHRSWFSEDCDPMEGADGATERLYPKRSPNAINPQLFYNVPSNLRRIYGELVDCFNNESPTLCAAGLRALVEGICAQQGVVDGPVEMPAKGGGTQMVRKNNLEGCISGLQEKGLLTQTSAQTLHEHRYLGNAAVHELARPSEDELRLAIEIIEHTLQQLYELPEKAEELKRAIARRKK